MDDEDANDSRLTASEGLLGAPGLVDDAGLFTLTAGDVDWILLEGLSAGSVVTAVTTPLDDPLFEDPDTILGLFDAGGVELAFSDDSPNSGGTFDGLGSLLRHTVAAGDYYIAVSGFGDTNFGGSHSEDGNYVLQISVVSLSVPEPTAALLVMAGLLGLLRNRRAV